MTQPAIAQPAIAGAVLTGGASRRMGRDKATLRVDGSAMARRVADALVEAGCHPVVAVGGTATQLATLGLRVVDDTWPGEGPLGAIIVALRDAGGAVLVAACDLPWLDGATVRQLITVSIAHPDADVVHAQSTRIEPLCALWRPSALAVIEPLFDAGERSMHAAIGALAAVACSVEAVRLTNINRPADLPVR